MNNIIDNELILIDRIGVIKDTISKYGEENFYLSFSGGKDSTVVSYLLDIAIPDNKIPRVFINTGIEYQAIVEFVHSIMANDDRFIEIKPSKPIKKMLNEIGYPFKSKEHSLIVSDFQKGLRYTSMIKYINREKGRFSCPKSLLYQFESGFDLKISSKCCFELKKKPSKKWENDNKKEIVITGMRKEEGGQRTSLNCIVVKNGIVKKFHPLAIIDDKWEDWFIEKFKVKLCYLYSPPYNFKRTGCKGCPFSLDLQQQLESMEIYLPNERKQCEYIWKPVYDEYRRINYRLNKNEQIKLF